MHRQFDPFAPATDQKMEFIYSGYKYTPQHLVALKGWDTNGAMNLSTTKLASDIQVDEFEISPHGAKRRFLEACQGMCDNTCRLRSAIN